MSDDRQDHEAKADRLEDQLGELEQRSEQLGEEIEGAGEQWERRKADDRVPGATGEPSQDEEAEDGDDGEELDFGRSLAEEGDGGEES